MCQECGCSMVGEVGIDGTPGRKVASPLIDPSPPKTEPGTVDPSHSHSHEHNHARGHTHTHTHGEGHGHTHDHGHGQEHAHAHTHAHSHDHHHEHNHGQEQTHDHDHDHAHDDDEASLHQALPSGTHRTVNVLESILAKNDRLAERNRGFFKAKGLLVLNVVSSPGSGKTTFIQQTAKLLDSRLRTGVIVGDLATDNDAARLRAAGVPVVQITTGTVCHLEAEMVARAMTRLDLDTLDLLIIENVGNLVCPAAYDLGEDLRVVLLSVTEGEDKPLKYAPMFHGANAAVVNKMDLASAVEFNRESALANLKRISPKATIFEVSARTGQGMDQWLDYLIEKHRAAKGGLE